MNWTDEEIDKLARDAASNAKQINYSKAYWKEVETLLGTKKSRKVGFWWWMSGLSLFLGMAFTFGWFVMSSERPFKKTGAVTTKAFTAKNKLLKPDSKGILTVSESAISSSHLSTQNNPNHRVEKSVITYNNSHSYIKTIVHRETNTSYDQPINRWQVSNSSPTHEDKAKATQSIEEITNSYGQGKEQGVNSSNTTHVDKGVEGSEEIVVIGSLNPLSLNGASSGFLNSPLKNLPLFPRRGIRFYASVKGGVGSSYLKMKTDNQLFQLGASGGIEFFRRNWSFGGGLGIYQQFLPNIDIMNTRKLYGFGLVNIEEHFSYDQLAFMALELNTHYFFGRNALGITTSPTYLVGVRSTYRQKIEEVVGESTTLKTKTIAYHTYVNSPNFVKFGVNLGVTYDYSLASNFSLTAAFNMRVSGKLLTTSSENGIERRLPSLISLGIKKRF